jgi:hypothetical protein
MLLYMPVERLDELKLEDMLLENLNDIPRLEPPKDNPYPKKTCRGG